MMKIIDSKYLRITLYRILRSLGVRREQILTYSSFKDDFWFDEYDLNQFLFVLEVKFNIRILENEKNKLVTVGSTIEYLQNKI